MTNTDSPDRHAVGVLSDILDPLRYDGHTADPQEVGGMLAAFVPLGARVLDVGCGTGSVSRILIETRNARLVGVEPDAARAVVARSRGIEVHEGVVTPELLQRLGLFDVIMFADVLEHVLQPTDLLQMVLLGLKTDGMVIASIPNVAHWSVRLHLLLGHFDYQPSGIRDATHLRWFTAHTVRALFESSGYKVNSLRQTAGITLPEYFTTRPWRWMPSRLRDRLVRILAHRLPLLFGCQHIVLAVPRS